jgi:hypothetical protein
MEVIEKFEDEYNSLMLELEMLKNKKITKLKDKFVKILPFQKGDIVYNVTGIIKIDSIDFEIGYNGRGELLPIHATFSGIKYKWYKGGFVRPTKSKQRGNLYSYGNLKKIDKNKIL